MTRQIPMQLAGVALGNQPFHLAGTDAAFHITTFQDELGAHHPLQLRKLAAPSPLKALHWVNLARLLPSHGPPVREPTKQLQKFAAKLERLERLYVRGYDPEGGSVAYQDKVSKPTVVSNMWQVSPHLFRFKRPNFWPNFSLILSDNGHALLSDCGLLDEKFLDTALDGMRAHFGLEAIDAVIVSHMHGDHFLEAQHLREKWGTQIWALSSEKDYRYWFDPFWVRAEPCRSRVQPGASVELKIHLRNFLSREQAYRVEIHTPPGLRADPPVLDTRLTAKSRREFSVRITAAPDAKPGVHLPALDITRDGQRHGELFDAIIEIE